MEGLLQDIRYGIRIMLKNPGFTALVALTLALGIGANTAIFSVVNTVLLKPLPYKDADRLVRVDDLQDASGQTINALAYPEYLDWKDRSEVFEQFAAYANTTYTMVGFGEPQDIPALRMSSSFPAMLGVTPLLGRSFLPEEEPSTGAPVVLISYPFWQKYFGGTNDAVGKTLVLNNEAYTIIGVLPPGAEGLTPSQLTSGGKRDIWTPLRLSEQRAPRELHFMQFVGKLRPGLPLEAANRELTRIRETLPKLEDGPPHGALVKPLKESIVGSSQNLLWLLTGSVGFILLIACANVANMLLARAEARRKEIAVRLAVGAARGRLMRQLLTESVLMSLVAGVFGTLIAWWSVELLQASTASRLPRITEIGIDTRVLFYTLGISVLTGLLFGLAPALRGIHSSVADSLKEGAQSSGGRREGFRKVLIAGEVALCMVLLIAAGLLIRSFSRVLAESPGFESQRMVTFGIRLPFQAYPEQEQQGRFYQQAVERIRNVPGVEEVAIVSELPFRGSTTNGSVLIEGREFPSGSEPDAGKRIVSADYFRVMHIPLVAGRYFTEQDRKGAPAVVIVSYSFAKKWFPGEDAIGKRIDFSWDTEEGFQEIVGVVGDIKHGSLEDSPESTLYVPYLQRPHNSMDFIVRTPATAAAIIPGIREQIDALDKTRPLANVKTVDELIEASTAARKFSLTLVSGFAALALVLACMGVYGVLSYMVSQRNREIGIRMALGAQRADVLGMVVREGMLLVAIGVAVGVAGAMASGRLVESMLYGIKPDDPPTFIVISITLVIVAALASYIPALRATRVDPMVVLRYE